MTMITGRHTATSGTKQDTRTAHNPSLRLLHRPAQHQCSIPERSHLSCIAAAVGTQHCRSCCTWFFDTCEHKHGVLGSNINTLSLKGGGSKQGSHQQCPPALHASRTQAHNITHEAATQTHRVVCACLNPLTRPTDDDTCLHTHTPKHPATR